MRLDMSQQMRMLQQMKLAPRMIQSMEILQLPIMALEERIREEVEQNATLELGASANEQPNTDLEAEFGDAASETAEHAKPEDDRQGPTEQDFDAIEQMVEEFNESSGPSLGPSRQAGMEMSDKKYEAMQNMVDRTESLEDHLLEQLTFAEGEPLVLEFAKHIVGNLNGRGFLNGPFEDIRSSFGSPLSDEQADMALKMVQAMDPVGVGARDLRECLLLQLEEPDPEMCFADILQVLIRDHLDDLEHNRLPAIEKKTGYSIELIKAAIDEMKHLDLNPGAQFVSAQTQYVIPDVTVDVDDRGEFVIKTNDDYTPNVKVSKYYLDMLRDKRGDPQTLEYVKRKIAAARWLLDAIEQRRNTVEKVTGAIIEHQRAFLEKGIEFIEPLKMQQIADRVGVHVTTVSRAVDDKWIQTPRGIFPLKRFFGGGTVTGSGEEVAWETIKRKLTEVVNGEDKAEPLSDEDLMQKMADLGYPLARRTVTKYRKMLGIPSSRQRKEHN